MPARPAAASSALSAASPPAGLTAPSLVCIYHSQRLSAPLGPRPLCWQTYLKDWKLVPRKPQWLRHYNLSVVPPRCGDINLEPLMPFDMSDIFIEDYAGVTIEAFSPYVLEKGECGMVGPNGNPRALSYTKRSNPASLGTPWLGPGGGSSAGPGDPGYNQSGGSLQALCLTECGCSTSGKPYMCTDADTCIPGTAPGYTYPACTDENCGGHAAPDGTHHQQGRCVVCSPSFNDREFTVRLWCDPADPACERGFATRAPLKVKILVSDWHRQSSSAVVDIGISQCFSSVFVIVSGQLRKNLTAHAHGQPSGVDGPQKGLRASHLELDHRPSTREFSRF